MDEDFDKSLVVCLTVSVYFNVPTRSVYYKEARSDVYESRNPAPFHAIWYSHADWLSVMCRYHFTFAVLYIFKQSIVPCMCKWHTRMSVALPPYVRHGHCIYFYFFKSAGIRWDIAAARKERTNNIHAAFIYIWQQMAMFWISGGTNHSRPPGGRSFSHGSPSTISWWWLSWLTWLYDGKWMNKSRERKKNI